MNIAKTTRNLSVPPQLALLAWESYPLRHPKPCKQIMSATGEAAQSRTVVRTGSNEMGMGIGEDRKGWREWHECVIPALSICDDMLIILVQEQMRSQMHNVLTQRTLLRLHRSCAVV